MQRREVLNVYYVSIAGMETETIFFLSILFLLAGVGLLSMIRAYRLRQRNKKAFDFNPWG